jgi:hypothetical protein
MAARIIPDSDKPSVAIEIPLEKPLSDYDLEQVEQRTPRDVDSVLVSQGFRDLVDDARGVLLEILCRQPQDPASASSEFTDLALVPAGSHPLEIAQLTGAICPGDDEIYRPGLWIVLRDARAPANQGLGPALLDRVKLYANELVKRLDLA